MPPLFSLLLIPLCELLVRAQLLPQPGSIPLAVKTPYLHAWIKSNGMRTFPAGVWPNFVSGKRTLGWGGMIRVDNKAYWWLGGNGPERVTTTVATEITPTRSIFSLEAGPIRFNATFFSPIEPNDYVRQSMPFSYLYIDAIAANDSQPHIVQLYSDISAEWVTGDDSTQVDWNTIAPVDNNNIIFHRIARGRPALMVENNEISEDATGYYATINRPGLTWQTGTDIDLRRMFANNGGLQNSGDVNFRQVPNNWPVFAFSVDMGTISPGDQPDPVVWSVGLVRDPLITYTVDQSQQNLRAYYWTKYSSISNVISAFLNDFLGALNRSRELDNKTFSTALHISHEYTGILSLVSRQIFASMDITIPPAQSGRFNNSDVRIFMKDVGVSSRTNPVEGIYGAFPALIFFNSSFARDLLQPLLEFQSSSRYTNTYAAPDLGNNYPLAQGNSMDTTALAIENCGNMLIMMYTYAAKSGDGTLLSRYSPILHRWADYLMERSLYPREFKTADGTPGPSNLALKGILGIYSMARINEAMSVSNNIYLDRATQLIEQWKGLTTATDGHIQAVYGATDTWGLMYNLFPAVWLRTGLIEDTVLDHQAQFYARQNFPLLGPGLDNSQVDVTYPHWTLMTAATISNGGTTVRDQLIESIYRRVSSSPLPVKYNSSNGSAISGFGNGSPILGAAFAVAALGINNTIITIPQIHKKRNVDAILGGVFGGLSFILLVTGIIHVWRRYKHTKAVRNKDGLDKSLNDYYANGTVGFFSYRTSGRSEHVRGSSIPLPFLSTGGGATAISPHVSRKQRGALSESNVPRQNEPAPNSSHAPVADDVRTDIEQLRREIQSLRHATEAPPEYS